GGFCFLFGTTSLFGEETLATLYPSHEAYVEAINQTTDSAVAAGFLLEADAALIKARALTSDIGRP
ncbi:MAG: alpha/beta hydrolase domain-containing protein, partial [Gammaproteobacteria bacterium]|nr:alpha/beta hydrolase domain-containing protein [Gammaproteobacteria bacterium]